MGLCKCPKRRVTNQFCFEHRVNVCEHCMVSNHPKCIIQSYLQWLQDSDYNPICELCSKDLIQEDCVRLTCYHVFHWSCLDQYSRQSPSTTAPAGYTCPACRTGLFPANNLVSPVADVLRQKLAAVNWARAGLGLPLLTEDREIKPAIPKAVSNGELNAKPNGPPYSVVHVEDTPYSRDSVDSYQTPASRRVFQDVRENKPSLLDHDDDKYKRRPASEWVRRWWKNSLPNSGQRRPTSIYKKYCMLGIIIFIAIIMIIVVMDKFGRRLAEDDPMLDFRQNDQIRVQDPLAQRSM